MISSTISNWMDDYEFTFLNLQCYNNILRIHFSPNKIKNCEHCQEHYPEQHLVIHMFHWEITVNKQHRLFYVPFSESQNNLRYQWALNCSRKFYSTPLNQRINTNEKKRLLPWLDKFEEKIHVKNNLHITSEIIITICLALDHTPFRGIKYNQLLRIHWWAYLKCPT